MDSIKITKANVHNLKGVSLEIPRHKLVVVTGLSGSGKSSLAFDTIYAEAQRRYLDTLSPYAKHFIGVLERPDIESIEGLSPTIAIEQKSTNKNPRSTVGTITEISDFLRLLYAKGANAYSPVTGEEMVKYSDTQIVDLILKKFAGQKCLILSPLIKGRKGHYKELFDSMLRKGYTQMRVDGQLCSISDLLGGVDRYKSHFIDLVVDKLIPKDEDFKRVRDSVQTALNYGKGSLAVWNITTEELSHFSKHYICPQSGISFPEPAPHTFSFNSPQGACPHCKGLGFILPEEDVDEEDSDYDIPISRMRNQGEMCPHCHGTRLKEEALYFRIDGKNIAEVSDMDIRLLYNWIVSLDKVLNKRQSAIALDILKELKDRVGFLLDVGLEYLSLSRATRTLSGGESQRIRLATQIGSKLVNVLYILDEPSIGLHQSDNRKLINSLKKLRDEGNSVMVVEHDEEMIRSADWLVDVGPGAGINGGEILYSGEPQSLMERFPNEGVSHTADYILRRKMIEVPLERRRGNGKFLELKGARGNNLKSVDIKIPLGCFVGISGVSGSGKSSLINETLMPILSNHFYHSLYTPLQYDEIIGIKNIDKLIEIDQTPLGRSPRSNPATYTGVFSDIRKLFELTPDAKIRGFNAGKFSFNVKGGRCEVCKGAGVEIIEMNFLPSVQVKCKECQGKRYKQDVLAVKYKGKSINDVLEMTIAEAADFFEPVPSIYRRIKALKDVGLGYIKLGHSSLSLSGGENQRVKLATELSKPSTGNSLYLLDEPTTGLHSEDIKVLLGVLQTIVDQGNTVVVIEHNLDVLKSVDYLFDMGPKGGKDGGVIVAEGTPEDVSKNPNSVTGVELLNIL